MDWGFFELSGMIYTVVNIGAEDQTGNAGHVRSIYLINKADVLGIMDPIRYQNSLGMVVPKNGISVVDGVEIVKLERLPLLGLWEEPRLESEQGYTYQPSFSLDLPRNTPGLLEWIASTEGQKYVALWEDRNGIAYMTGSSDNALKVNVSRQVRDINTVMVQLTALMPTPSFVLESINLAELFPLADFSFSFSMDFNA